MLCTAMRLLTLTSTQQGCPAPPHSLRGAIVFTTGTRHLWTAHTLATTEEQQPQQAASINNKDAKGETDTQ